MVYLKFNILLPSKPVLAFFSFHTGRMQENREREPQVTKGRGRIKTTATTRRTPAAAATEKEAGPGAKTAVPKARGGRGSTPRGKMVHQLQAAVSPQANLKVDLGGERIIILEGGTKAAAVIGVERGVGKVERMVGRRNPTNSSSRKRAHQIMPTTWGFSWEGSLGKPEPKT